MVLVVVWLTGGRWPVDGGRWTVDSGLWTGDWGLLGTGYCTQLHTGYVVSIKYLNP